MPEHTANDLPPDGATTIDPARVPPPESTPPTPPATPPASRSRWRRIVNASRIRRASSVLVILLVWELNARISQNRLTPTLDVVFERLAADLLSGELWFHGRLTLFRGFTGLAIALVLGVIVGFAMARSRWLDAALHPVLVGLYPIPKLALYPIAILILGFGGASKIWQVGLECFFPIAYNAYAGARAVDRNMLWLARNSGASRLQTVRDVVWPSALPSILTGLRISTPIMLIVITVTELLGESRGLGFLIRDSQARFIADRAIAVVIVLGVLGFLFDRLLVWMTRRLVYWEKDLTL